jgi:hypothetical protein
MVNMKHKPSSQLIGSRIRSKAHLGLIKDLILLLNKMKKDKNQLKVYGPANFLHNKILIHCSCFDDETIPLCLFNNQVTLIIC